MSALTTLPAASVVTAATITGLTFIDGLVLGGLVINGWGAFAACLYAYGNGLLGIPALILLSFVGVFTGEQVSFGSARWAGGGLVSAGRNFAGFCDRSRKRSKLGFAIPALSPQRWDHLLALVSRKVDRWGGVYLIVGRWTPVASLVPATCGLTGMSYRRFTSYSFISCLLWSSLWNFVVFATVKGYFSL
jgi:membrane protein DedA with SNARE-associated domain